MFFFLNQRRNVFDICLCCCLYYIHTVWQLFINVLLYICNRLCNILDFLIIWVVYLCFRYPVITGYFYNSCGSLLHIVTFFVLINIYHCNILWGLFVLLAYDKIDYLFSIVDVLPIKDDLWSTTIFPVNVSSSPLPCLFGTFTASRFKFLLWSSMVNWLYLCNTTKISNIQLISQ